MWRQLGPHRLLIAVYAVVTIAGLWEFTSQSRPDAAVGRVDWTNGDEGSFSDMLEKLYPDSPDAAYFRGFRVAIRDRNPHAARKHFEQALASGVKHNEDLFYFYALALMYSGAEDDAVDRAVRKWRRNYPSSRRPLAIPFVAYAGRGDPAQRARLALSDLSFVDRESVRLTSDPTLEMRFLGSRVDIKAVKTALREANFTFEEAR